MLYLLIFLPFLVEFGSSSAFELYPSLDFNKLQVIREDDLYCATHYDHGDFKIEKCKNNHKAGIINACIYMVIPSSETVRGRYVYGCAPLNSLPPNCSEAENPNKPQAFYYPYTTIIYNGTKISGALACCGDNFCNESEEPPISAVRLKSTSKWTEAFNAFLWIFISLGAIVCMSPLFVEYVEKIYRNGRDRVEIAEMLPTQRNELIEFEEYNRHTIIRARFKNVTRLNTVIKNMKRPDQFMQNDQVSEREGNFQIMIHHMVYNYKFEAHKVQEADRENLTNRSTLAERMIEHGPYEFNFDLIELAEMFDTVSHVFEREPTVLDLPDDIFVIGNLEGSYADLFRWFHLIGWPPRCRVLFLGGLTSDDERYSLETIALIFALKIQFPHFVYVIRGGSECAALDLTKRLPEKRRMGNAISDVLLRACSQLPLAATISDRIFCSHGGVPIKLNTLGQIRKIRRPIAHIRKGSIEADLIFSVVSNQNHLIPGSRAHMFDPFSQDFFQLAEKLQMDYFIRSRNPVKSGHQITGNFTLNIWSAPGRKGTEFGSVININPEKKVTLLRAHLVEPLPAPVSTPELSKTSAPSPSPAPMTTKRIKSDTTQTPTQNTQKSTEKTQKTRKLDKKPKKSAEKTQASNNSDGTQESAKDETLLATNNGDSEDPQKKEASEQSPNQLRQSDYIAQ